MHIPLKENEDKEKCFYQSLIAFCGVYIYVVCWKVIETNCNRSKRRANLLPVSS